MEQQKSGSDHLGSSDRVRAEDAKHAPGPWEASAVNAIWAISPWNARVCIANVTMFSPMNGIDGTANARLIAAAPELLEALRGLMADNSHLSMAQHFELAAKARAAIAKATGSAQ